MEPITIYHIAIFTLNLSLIVLLTRDATSWVREHARWSRDRDRFHEIARKKVVIQEEAEELVEILARHFTGKGKAIITAYMWLFYAVFVLSIDLIHLVIRLIS